MAFKKGQSGNPNGKPKGAINKSTKEIREVITQVVSNSIENLQRDLDELPTKDRVKIIIELIQYVTPKLKAVGFDEISEKESELDLSGITTEELILYLEKLK